MGDIYKLSLVTYRLSDVARILHQEGHGVHVHDIREKSPKFLHKYNKLMLSQLKRL